MTHALPEIRPQQRPSVDDVFALWDLLGDVGFHKTDAALRICLERLGAWLGAQDGFWIGLVRIAEGVDARDDVLGGWRIRAIETPNPQLHDARSNRKFIKSNGAGMDPGAAVMALVRGAGRFRAYSLRSGQLVTDLRAFEKTGHYDLFYRRRGVVDRIWVAAPVSESAESVFCFDRLGQQGAFTAEDLLLAQRVLQGIKWFHRQILLSHGLGICAEPLTPVERRVVHELLMGGSEREVAERMRLSQGSLHQYATRIYRKFGVRGRIEFNAIWLAQR